MGRGAGLGLAILREREAHSQRACSKRLQSSLRVKVAAWMPFSNQPFFLLGYLDSETDYFYSFRPRLEGGAGASFLGLEPLWF